MFRFNPIPTPFWTGLTSLLAIGVAATTLLNSASAPSQSFVLLWLCVVGLIGLFYLSVRQQHGREDDRILYAEVLSVLSDGMNYARKEDMNGIIAFADLTRFYDIRDWSGRPERRFMNKSVDTSYESFLLTLNEFLDVMIRHSHSDGDRVSPKFMYPPEEWEKLDAARREIDAAQTRMVEAYDRFVRSAKQFLAK